MAHEKYEKECNMLYLSTENQNCSFPDEFRLYIVLISNNCLFTQFSYGATDLALTTDKKQYPLFFRTVPTEIVFNEPRLQFVQHFGWKDEIGLIYDASPYYSQVR